MDYTDYINAVYQQYLGRTPSGDEVAFVNNSLNSGFTLSDLTAGIQGSPEYQQKQAQVQADPSSRVSVDNPQEQSPFATPDPSPVSAPVNATLQQAVNYLTNQQSSPYINNASLLQPHAPNSVVTDTSGAPIAIYDANGNLSTWHDNKGVVHNISELQFQTPTYMRNPTYSSDLGNGANGTGMFISPQEAASIGVPFDNTPQLTQDSAAKLTVDMGGTKGQGFIDWGKLITVLSVPLTAGGSLAAVAAEMGVDAATLSTALQVVKGGIQGALSGGDPIEGAIKGAASAGISAGLTPELAASFSSGLEQAIGTDLANTGGKVLANALTGAAKGYFSGGAAGAVTGAETGALTTAATEGLGAVGKGASSVFEPQTVEWSREDQPAANYVIDSQGNFQLDSSGNPITIEQWRQQNTDSLAKGLKAIGAPWISQNISNLFASSPSSSDTSGSGVSTSRTSKTGIQPTYTGAYSTPSYSSPRQSTSQSSGSVTTTGQPNTQALSQALSVGSPSSGISDTGQSESPATGGVQQPVWNLSSLRVKDATGSSTE